MMADTSSPRTREAWRRRLVKASAVKVASSKLTLADQGSLQWFFGRGQVIFEGSMMGGMLERAHMFHLQEIREMYKKNGERSPDPHGHETARPTAEVREASGHVPDDKMLIDYAWISRVLPGLTPLDR